MERQHNKVTLELTNDEAQILLDLELEYAHANGEWLAHQHDCDLARKALELASRLTGAAIHMAHRLAEQQRAELTAGRPELLN